MSFFNDNTFIMDDFHNTTKVLKKGYDPICPPTQNAAQFRRANATKYGKSTDLNA